MIPTNECSFDKLNRSEKLYALQVFDQLLRNEQIKANVAVQSFNEGRPFGGTSISALVARPTLPQQIVPCCEDDLAEIVAESYLEESKRIRPVINEAFTKEEVDLFETHGAFYGVHVSPKLIALSEKLYVEHKDLILPGFPEPYTLPNESSEVVKTYFAELKKQRGFHLNLQSLLLADTTTPKGFEGKKILNPACLNEKLVSLSSKVTHMIRNKGHAVDSLYFISTDTDSPQRMLLATGQKPIEGFPLTPGLTMCGSTATMDGFDFKYAYRIGLISQMLSSNIVASKAAQKYNPFIFIGMLSPFGYSNGAIPTGEMGHLRYLGDIDVRKEFLHQFENVVHRM